MGCEHVLKIVVYHEVLLKEAWGVMYFKLLCYCSVFYK